MVTQQSKLNPCVVAHGTEGRQAKEGNAGSVTGCLRDPRRTTGYPKQRLALLLAPMLLSLLISLV